ncbi:MAG: hypothetical protein F6K31_19660 [Symploca sp. SIO2G7]|nr:hypothetical protein [Symploca sp. SIO2G7]
MKISLSGASGASGASIFRLRAPHGRCAAPYGGKKLFQILFPSSFLSCCLLPVACCLLLVACCLLPVACCLVSQKAPNLEPSTHTPVCFFCQYQVMNEALVTS